MNNLVSNNVKNLIYEVRGKQVMLDSDLAKLYQVETKRINEAVKNNPGKFPERFAFRITELEVSELKTKISTSKKGGSRKGHTVFTEQGVAMLATILKSKTATEVSIAIMDAFVLMRKYISNELIEQKFINKQVLRNTEDIKQLQESFQRFEEKKIVNEIFFNGQIYDAYSKLTDIIKSAEKELIIIDSYADKSVLDMISNVNVKVTLICKENGLLKNIDIKKYNSQYDNLKIIYDNTFHDRYLIIDFNIIYHCGASFKDLGKKCFAINKIEDQEYLNELVSNVSFYANSEKNIK